MRLSISKSKNSTLLYAIKSTYENGKHSTKIVEKLGNIEELEKKLNGADPIEWAKNYIKELTRLENEEKLDVIVKYTPTKLIEKDKQNSFNGGYLFLQQIYHELGLHKICKDITTRHKFTFDLNSVLSRLIYGRVIFPASKLSTYDHATKFMEKPNFELQHIYRGLSVIAEESDFIQSELYKKSLKMSDRNKGILYYDCTNFFFEIDQEENLKQYGFSKEHRPNPIVQMGLFMDGDGIPLAFSINKGNTNEQITLKPLEQKIISDFNLSKFIVCTDAGLASQSNRKFNSIGERAFITTQSIKKLKTHLKKWALDPTGWKLAGDKNLYDINKLDLKNDINNIYYKEEWMNENNFEQKLIVTFSLKYKNYQEQIRNSQIERARKAIDNNPTKLKKCNANDYKRFISKHHFTPEGELAEKEFYAIDNDLIEKEASYDGFYGVCTNLEDEATEIIKVNSRRWEIEECFRIMKSEFKARPVYLSRDDRIEAHFMTCFISLMIFRFLEKRLEEKYTCSKIITGLREMNFFEVKGDGYIPTYTRNDFTDDLHEKFGFRTDNQIVTKKNINKIFHSTKK